MASRYVRSMLAWTNVVGLAWSAVSESALGQQPLVAVGTEELKSLSTTPEKVALRGAGRDQQLGVTGHLRDCRFRPGPPTPACCSAQPPGHP
jgi:hypothetical protein